MHEHSRRQFLADGIAALSAVALPVATARAEQFPTRPIRIITPNSAGSSADIIARRLGDHFGRAWKASVIVDNIPGAGGIIGTEKLIASAADGYTLAVVATNHVILPLVNPAVRYNPLTQITPVCAIFESCGVLAASPSFPPKTAAELFAYAKANPGKVNFGTSGVGTSVDLTGRMLQQIGAIEVVNVPYKGVANMLPDLMSGLVDVAMFGLSAVSEHIRSGALVGLGITRRQRLASFPNIPPIRDSVPSFNMSGWYALIAPAGMNAAVAKQISDEVARLQADKTFIELAAKDGDVPLVMAGATFKSFLDQESMRIAALVKSANIKII